MIRSPSPDQLEQKTSEQSTENHEVIDRPDDIKLQVAALFDSCIVEANRNKKVTVAENVFYRLGEETQTNAVLVKIYNAIPDNQARVITILPHHEQDSIRHIFYLRRVSGSESITTNFKIDHTEKSIDLAKIEQTFSNGQSTRKKIMEVDANGGFVDLHFDDEGNEVRLTDPDDCQPDLVVVSEAVTESVEEAVRHTTLEFERVEHPDGVEVPDEVPEGLFRAAVFGVKHRGEGLKIAA